MIDLTRLSNRLDGVTCRAIVETPAGSRAKFNYDPRSGLFELGGMLPAGMAFPLDFGFVPATRGEDGDPIDVLLLSEAALPVGCLAEVALLGVIEAEQTETKHGETSTCRNDRLVARLAASRAFGNVDTLAQLGEGFRDELGRFFTTYNDLKGKRFKVLGVHGPARAVAAIARAAIEAEQ